MERWLRDRIHSLVEDFLGGAGDPKVFEAMFITYLECLAASRQGTDATDDVWTGWRQRCADATPSGEKVACLSTWVHDRQTLVEALQTYRFKFEGPKSHRPEVPKEKAQKNAPTRSGFESVLDLLEGLE